LIISNIATPHYLIERPFAPIVWLGNSSLPMMPLYKTQLGNFNGTYLSFTFENGKEVLIHDYTTKNFSSYIGVYQNSAKLFKSNNLNFFQELEVIPSGADKS